MPEHNERQPETSQSNEQNILDVLKRLVIEREGPPPTKPMESYNFWKTQPVTRLGGPSPENDGEIEHKTVDDVPKNPQKLPEAFKWVFMDVNSDADLKEIHELLYENYIEDADQEFRFNYSATFLRWALRPPGWQPEWSVGVRAVTSGKLVAFISAIPAHLKVHSKPVDAVEINFLCVHKQLRSKRLAPVLIKEITRQCNLKGIWHALFTAGTLIPTPVATCRYFHRPIDWSKLYDVGFSYLPPDSTPSREVARYSLPRSTDLPGFRSMQEKDLPSVHELLSNYLRKFDLTQEFTIDDLRHWLLGSSTVSAYVVASDDGKITDMISYYGISSSVLGNSRHDSINVAYAFYYATSGDAQRLQDLFRCALIMSKQQKYDVFNALTLLDNHLVLKPLKFAPGDGVLRYNLFNYQCKPISGGFDKNDVQESGIGVVML